MEGRNYTKEERFDAGRVEALKHHYAEILRLLGEDPAREGLLKTPERVAKAMAFLTKGYDEDPLEIIRSATFREEYRQMVLVKDIELYSLCEHHMLAVVIEASHMCMQMRGIEKQQSATTTSAFTGVFLSSQRTREEFMTLISHRYR